MSQDEKAIAAANLEYVESQVLAPNCDRIVCPYCKQFSFRSARAFCCDTLRHAVIAILYGQRALKIAEAAEKAMQN